MAGLLRISSIARVYLLRKNASAVQRVRLTMTNKAAFSPEIEEVVYEGDGGKTKIFRASSFDIELTGDTFDLTALETVFAKTPVTAGLTAPTTARTYWMTGGDAGGISVGVECIAQAIDDTDNSSKIVAIVAPVGTLSTLTPPELGSLTKAPQTLQFSAKATGTDIAGNALPGIGAGVECYWYIDIMSSIPAAG